MAIIDTTTRTYAARDMGTSFSFVATLSRMLEALQMWNDIRVTRRSLNGLTDRELADIGLHRGDIESIARTGQFN